MPLLTKHIRFVKIINNSSTIIHPETMADYVKTANDSTVEVELTSHTSSISTLETNVTSLNTTVSSHTTSITDLDTRVSVLENKYEKLLEQLGVDSIYLTDDQGTVQTDEDGTSIVSLFSDRLSETEDLEDTDSEGNPVVTVF